MYLNGGSSNTPKIKEIQSKDKPKEQKSHIKLYNMALQNQDKAIEYLKNRGLKYADEIAKYFQIGYIPEYAYEFDNGKPSKVTPAVIIPMSDYSYSWRSTTENLKKKSGAIIPLNLKYKVLFPFGLFLLGFIDSPPFLCYNIKNILLCIYF